MLRVLAAALIVLQLRPVAEAAACMARSRPAETCEMATSPMPAPAPGGAPHQSTVPAAPMPCECPAVLLCGVSTAAVLPTIIRESVWTVSVRPGPQPGRVTLHPADPIAPPVPPPNA